MIKNHIVYTGFSAWKFKVKKAQGSLLWDEKGKKYIDFTSGWNVTNLGWNHPEISKAIETQTKKMTYNPMWTSVEIQELYAKKLLQVMPKGMDAVCRVTGGTEANEEALKISRVATGRKKIIGFRHTYHGQSFGALAIGFVPEAVKAISPLVPKFIQIDYPETYRTKATGKKVLERFLDNLEKILSKKDVAAIVTEAGIITGEGTTWVAPKGYLKAVRKLTKKYGTLMILDEVGTGFSRVGKLFGFELEQVKPDIITLAKGISNGAAAIGAVVVSSKLVKPTIPKTTLVSTFGWTPIACAAALKTLEIHQRDKVWKKAKLDGDHIKKRLKKELSNHPFVGDVRGIGMEIGIDFVLSKKTKKKNPKFVDKVIKQSLEKGLHLASVVQLMPPLTIPRKILDQGIDILIDVINKSK